MTEPQPTLTPQDWLAQLLSSGRELLDQAQTETDRRAPELKAKARALQEQGEDFIIDKFGMDDTEASRETIRKQAQYAGLAGAIALLVQSRSARKLAALGGLGALGVIAYRGHQNGKMPDDFKEAIGLLTGKPAEVRANILIKAMVSAARADGSLSETEMAVIKSHPEADLDRLESWLTEPSDPDEIAALARGDQMAAEIYAVSCRVADGINPAERNYLDRLAMALRLDPEAAALIETDIRTGL